MLISSPARWLVVGWLIFGCAALASASEVLDAERLSRGAIAIDRGWFYAPGNGPSASVDWQPLAHTASNAALRWDGWPGIGRFRVDLEVAPDLVDSPIALRLDHPGASIVSLDGDVVARYGVATPNPSTTRAFNPRAAPTTVIFDRPGRHRLEILYACHAAAHPTLGPWLTSRRGMGFALQLDLPARASRYLLGERVARLGLNLGLGCFALGFALLHGLLFALHRGHPGNFWLALFALMLACNGFLEILRNWLPVGLWGHQGLGIVNAPIAIGLVLSAIGFLVSIHPDRTPHRAVRWLRAAAIPVFLSYALHGLVPIPSLLSLWILASLPVAVLLAISAWRDQGAGSQALLISASGWVLIVIGELLKARLGLAFEIGAFGVGVILVLGGSSLFLAGRIADEGHAAERQARELETRVRARTAELKRSERQAQVANRAKSAFLATMSHEIRTPMNAILGVSQLLGRSELPTRERGMVATLERSAASLLRLIGDILDLSRIEAGRLDLDEQAIWLEPMVRDVADLFALQAEKQGLELTWTVADDLPAVVLSDPVRLRQILVNLVGNALKFTPEGRVEMITRRDAEQLVIEVCDTGIGIPPDRREKLFQPFVQADGSSARRHAGAGLGLAICRQLATAMDGSLTAHGASPHGTIFRLIVPLRAASPADIEADRRTAEHPDSPSRRLRILLAEDNPINQEVVALMIEDLGHSLTMVDCGEAVFDAIDDADFDLLLLDLHMPDLDGVEVARRLRSAGSSMPIVALTASVLPADRERCRAVGMDGFLAKPVRFETLQQTFARFSRDERTGSFQVSGLESL